MSNRNVRSALFCHTPSDVTAQSFLFHFAVHYSRQGRKVLFISPRQIDRLPPIINDSNSGFDPVAFQRIRFLYIESRERLIETLVSSHSQPEPPTVIIVDQLEQYFTNEVEASGVGALLHHTAQIVGAKTGGEGVAIASHASPKSVASVHFKTLWSIMALRDQVMLLNETSQNEQSGPSAFLFSRQAEGNLKLIKVMGSNKLTLDSIKFDTDIDY